MKTLFLIFAFCFHISAFSSQWYVSTTGTGTTGTLVSPMGLSNALNVASSPAQPGDTIWLLGGTYAGSFISTLVSPSNNPIIIRNYQGERATLDYQNYPLVFGGAVLGFEGSGTWFWGLEITCSATNRWIVRPDGVGFNTSLAGANNKLINCIVHDTADGIFMSHISTNAEVSGCVIYNGGYDGTNGGNVVLAARGHGHYLYIQNDLTNGTKVIQNNIALNSFSAGVHLYGQAAQVCGIQLLNNIFYGAGAPSSYSGPPYPGQSGDNVIAESGVNLSDIVFGGNVGYSTGGWNWTFGSFSKDGFVQGSLVFTNNLSLNGAVGFYDWKSLTVLNNTLVVVNGYVLYSFETNGLSSFLADSNHYYGPGYGLSIITNGNAQVTFANWQSSGFDIHSTGVAGYPTDSFTAVIQKNPYESGRANIAIANWHTNDTVNVDVSGVLTVGQKYELRNAANYYGTPVLSGTYNGSALSVPTHGLTPVQVIGWTNTPPETGPFFNAFVLLPLISTDSLNIGTLNISGSLNVITQ